MSDSQEIDSKAFFRAVVASRELASVPQGLWVEKRKLAEALRRLHSALLTTGATAEELEELRSRVEAATAVFGASEAGSEPQGEGGGSPRAAGMETMQERSPIVGHANPLAPPLDLRPDVEDELVYGDVEFSLAYQGAPGCVHGGYVAAAFDEALGIACTISGQPAMTGELTTRYVRPTPILTPLRMVARFDGIEGRKILTSATLHAGDELVATARGVFITIASEKFVALKDRFERRQGAAGGADSGEPGDAEA